MAFSSYIIMCDLRSVLATGFFMDLQTTEQSGPRDAHLHKMSTSETEAHMQVPCPCSSCLFLVFFRNGNLPSVPSGTVRGHGGVTSCWSHAYRGVWALRWLCTEWWMVIMELVPVNYSIHVHLLCSANFMPFFNYFPQDLLKKYVHIVHTSAGIKTISPWCTKCNKFICTLKQQEKVHFWKGVCVSLQ